MANRLLYEAWAQRTQYEFTLSRSYAYCDPADLICINDQCLRITSLAYGDPGLVKIKAVSEDSRRYDSTLQTREEESRSTPTQNNTDVLLPSPTQLMLYDIPILQDTDDDTGFYVECFSHLTRMARCHCCAID